MSSELESRMKQLGEWHRISQHVDAEEEESKEDNWARSIVSSFLRNCIRPYFPRITRQYNGGVKVKDYSLIDPVLGAESFIESGYKENLVEAVREAVSAGDDVVVVGGGFGVAAVHAYRKSKGRVTRPGEITVYECSEERFQVCAETFELNDVEVNLRKSAVGVVKKKIGDVSQADFVHPSDLPECDVLELDCEGAELEILKKMSIRPETIVVETHEEYGSPTEDVKGVLEEIGYSVEAERPDCPDTNDNVLTAEFGRGEVS